MGRAAIVPPSLGIRSVICGYRGDAIPFHPSSNGCLTVVDAKNAAVPFLSTELELGRHSLDLNYDQRLNTDGLLRSRNLYCQQAEPLVTEHNLTAEIHFLSDALTTQN